MRASRLNGLALLLLVGANPLPAQDDSADKKYKLAETSEDSRPFEVEYTLDVSGLLSEQAADETKSFPLQSKAVLKYTERRLPSAGRDAAALRSLRYFDRHETDVTVEEHKSELRLPPDNRLFVVQGRDAELLYYPPAKLLSARLLEQLRIPFDTLSALSLLPKTAIEQGDSWTPDTWCQQVATGVEAVLSSEFRCTLKEVKGEIAFVELKGKLSGGRFGASTELEFEGGYEFDLTENALRELHVTLRDKSSISPVSPGLDIAANIRFTRRRVAEHPQLPDDLLAKIPLDPAPERLLLHFDSQWGTRFLHTRDWHIIPGQYVVLRLVENGSLITQGTMMPLPRAEPGEHTPTRQFQADIRKSLGQRLRDIRSAEQLPARDGQFLYRVTAVGQSNGREMIWRYYLNAHPDGRQVSFVFSTEAELLEDLADRDLHLVGTLSWPQATEPRKAP
jgi:hypothetical protein